MLEVAFVRSPVAHARIAGASKPAGLEDRVWFMSDLAGVKPIRAVSGLKGFKPSDLWPLARGKVRHVGEAVAMCAARDARRGRGYRGAGARSSTKTCRRWST